MLIKSLFPPLTRRGRCGPERGQFRPDAPAPIDSAQSRASRKIDAPNTSQGVIVLSTESIEIDPAEIHNTTALLTMVNGGVVHEAAGDWGMPIRTPDFDLLVSSPNMS